MQTLNKVNEENKLANLVENLRKKFNLGQVIYSSSNGDGLFHYTRDIEFSKNVTLKYFRTGTSPSSIGITHEEISLFGEPEEISQVEKVVEKEILNEMLAVR